MKLHCILLLATVVFLGCKNSSETSVDPESSEPVPTQPPDGDATGDQVATDSDLITIISWNVESGGNDPEVIASQLSDLGPADVYCLNEVFPDNFERYRLAVGAQYQAVNSVSGNEDRLQIIYSATRFELLDEKEHDDINDGRHRSPLSVRLRDRERGTEFVVMTNHLARGNAEFRVEQAEKIREWGRDASVTTPLICIGDMNMDYTFATGKGNDSFPAIQQDQIWQWCKPSELIDTNWYDGDGDGMDNYPGSMLDLAFVAGPAKEWSPVCSVIKREGDFPDDETTSDHRPIKLVLKPKN